MAAVDYKLKSAMLYTGCGYRGHWRSLVKERPGYVVYNGDRQPVVWDRNRKEAFNRELRKGINFIFVAEKCTDGQTDSSHGADISGQQGTSAIHDEIVPNPFAFPKPSTSGTSSLPVKSMQLEKGQNFLLK